DGGFALISFPFFELFAARLGASTRATRSLAHGWMMRMTRIMVDSVRGASGIYSPELRDFGAPAIEKNIRSNDLMKREDGHDVSRIERDHRRGARRDIHSECGSGGRRRQIPGPEGRMGPLVSAGIHP